MKNLLFLFLLIFSSQSFANSVVGKSLICYKITEENAIDDEVFGFYFNKKDNVQWLRFIDRSIGIFDLIYKIKLTQEIWIGGSNNVLNRKTLKYDGYAQCYLVDSRKELISKLKSELKKILKDNQL